MSTTLPSAVEAPSRIAVFGDSGCKPKDQQGCGLDDPQWPFPALARAAASHRPELVVLLGDYIYGHKSIDLRTENERKEAIDGMVAFADVKFMVFTCPATPTIVIHGPLGL